MDAAYLKHLDYLHAAHKGKQPHTMKQIIIRIRTSEQPYGSGVAMAFNGDDLDQDDPDHESALDKIASFIGLTMDNSHG
jgi:hypothetical protein